ncbi:beta/gamma crystallin domain-containing protein [Bacillus cereus]|nr:beta/gamma crystallin domain-containing protein [Bacillus cereus]MDA2135514.1 beta/gamma crystallin domain-containing protein [Bacillus cereus]
MYWNPYRKGFNWIDPRQPIPPIGDVPQHQLPPFHPIGHVPLPPIGHVPQHQLLEPLPPKLENRFFEHINGVGRSFVVYSGEFNEYVGDYFNDKISSISIAPRTVVLSFEHRGYQGEFNILINRFNDPQLINIHKNDWNDRVSSIKTYRLCFQGAWTNWFYEHINGTGKHYALLSNQTQSYVGSEWNDKISSISVGPHSLILLYEHRDFQGRVKYFENFGNTPILINIHKGWSNDQVSSIQTFQLCRDNE